MAIQVKCDCGEEYQVPDDKAGMEMKCAACGRHVVVPGAGQPAPGRQELSMARFVAAAQSAPPADPQVDQEAEQETGEDPRQPRQHVYYRNGFLFGAVTGAVIVASLALLAGELGLQAAKIIIGALVGIILGVIGGLVYVKFRQGMIEDVWGSSQEEALGGTFPELFTALRRVWVLAGAVVGVLAGVELRNSYQLSTWEAVVYGGLSAAVCGGVVVASVAGYVGLYVDSLPGHGESSE